MDKLTHYRNVIKELFTERTNLMRSQPLPGEEILCVLEEETDNYLLMRVGWVRGEHLYSNTLHVRLVNAKIQVEQDWTDDFVPALLEAGVPREDLVFAFSPSSLPTESNFAVV